mgnify:CR=1 FL=1
MKTMNMISRRNFLKAALGAAAVSAFSLTGCGGSGEGPALSVCVGGAPEELDPIYATETADQTVLVHLYENLMRKTGDGSGGTTVTNGAAKSVSTEENADGTVTWTFKLRKAEWSDGRAVRAGDFVFAWQRLADPANDSPSASLLSVVAGYDAVRETGDVSLLQVTAEDDSTLVVVLNGKFDWFLTEVCTAPATMPLRQDVVQRLKQEADAANDNLKEDETPRRWWSDPTRLVTNGPYTASAEDENALTLTENTAYGKKLTGPEDLTFRFGDTQTAEVLYDQGVVDAVWPLTEEEMAEQMEADETWQAEPVLETYSVMFNCSRLEDESIRKALSLLAVHILLFKEIRIFGLIWILDIDEDLAQPAVHPPDGRSGHGYSIGLGRITALVMSRTSWSNFRISSS